jgi:hypothetical protein
MINDIRKPGVYEEDLEFVPGSAWLRGKSGPNGACLEFRELTNGHFAVRDSNNPDGPVLEVTYKDVRAFVEGAKEGMFDTMLRTAQAAGSVA